MWKLSLSTFRVVGGLGCGWAKLNVVFLCRLVRWQNTSFNFAKRWHFRPPFLSICCRVVGLLGLLVTFSGLAKAAIFTTNVDAENQTLINHKCVCGALNRHFCQTRVTSCFSHQNFIISSISLVA
jgi:hypothetical protein